MISKKSSLLVFVIAICLLTSVVASANPVTIRYQDWRLTEKPSDDVLRTLVKEFEAQNPDIKVEIQGVPAAQRESAFVTQYRAGDAPDVVRMLTTGVGSFVTMGALLPLDRFIDEAYLEQHADYLVQAGRWNDGVYSIPAEGGAFGLYYNARLFEEAGLDPNKPPATWEELFDYAQKLTKPEESQWGIVLRGINDVGTPLYLQTWYLANGVDFFSDDLTETFLDSPEGLEIFQFMIELHTKYGLVPPGPADTGYIEMINYFSQGQVAMMQNHEVAYGIAISQNPEIAQDIRIAPFPGKVQTSSGRGSVFGISSQTRHEDAAWRLIDFLTNEESQQRLFDEASVYPSLESVLASENMQADPIAAQFSLITSNATSYPLLESWPRAAQIISDAIQKALVGDGEPDEIMIQAAKQVREIL